MFMKHTPYLAQEVAWDLFREFKIWINKPLASFIIISQGMDK